VFTVLHISRQKKEKGFLCKKKDQKRTISAGPKRKKGPKKDHFSRTKKKKGLLCKKRTKKGPFQQFGP